MQMFAYYPDAFLKKRRGYCNRLRPSRYLLLNHWKKSNQIWCVSCSHEWGMQRHIFFWPRPLGRGKRSNIIKFQLLSQFQRFLKQTLLVFSQKKDIKHIRRDFHLAVWVWGVPGGWGGVGVGGQTNFFPQFNQIW